MDIFEPGMPEMGPDMPAKPFEPQNQIFTPPPQMGAPRGFSAPPKPMMGGGFSAPPMMPQDKGFGMPGSFEAMVNNMTPRQNVRKAMGMYGPDSEGAQTAGEILDLAAMLKGIKAEVDAEASFGEPVGFDMRFRKETNPYDGDPEIYSPVSQFLRSSDPKSWYAWTDPDTGELIEPDKKQGFNVPRDEEQIAAEEGRVTDKQKAVNQNLRIQIVDKAMRNAPEMPENKVLEYLEMYGISEKEYRDWLTWLDAQSGTDTE